MIELIERIHEMLLEAFCNCLGVMAGVFVVGAIVNPAPGSTAFRVGCLFLGVVACFALALYLLCLACEVLEIVEDRRQ